MLVDKFHIEYQKYKNQLRERKLNKILNIKSSLDNGFYLVVKKIYNHLVIIYYQSEINIFQKEIIKKSIKYFLLNDKSWKSETDQFRYMIKILKNNIDNYYSKL